MKKKLNGFLYEISTLRTSSKIIYGIIFGLIIFAILKKVAVKPSSLLMILALAISVICHEVAHGYVALLNGDPTAKIAGRLTLNPVRHIDPIGLILPIFLILTGSGFVIGWAKPVPISYRMLRDKKWGVFFVAIAGVSVNIILAVSAALIIRLLSQIQNTENMLVINIVRLSFVFLQNLMIINVILAIFNLLPIPPLDGSRVVRAFGNLRVKNFLDSMERFGFIIIIGLMMTGLLEQILKVLYTPFINVLIKISGI